MIKKKKKDNKMDTNNIARNWRVLMGENHWKGLLDPLNIDLRRCIVHYGKMIGACGDNFNSNKTSTNAGRNRYSKKHMLSKVGLENGNPFKYTVTKYLFATSSTPFTDAFFVRPLLEEDTEWKKETNWMGYVAVATDEGKAALGRRDIIIAWRGTVEDAEWLDDLQIVPVSAAEIFGQDKNPKVHGGFYSIYTSDNPISQWGKTSARDQALDEVKRLVEAYKDEDVSITVIGHSLGAALATINAADIVINGFNKPRDKPDIAIPVTTMALASPRVGDSNFKSVFESQENLRALRVANATDIVPKLPCLLGTYIDVGEELPIDATKSEYLKDGIAPHNLYIYLHGKLEDVNLDLSLVNKELDGLKDEYRIPISWWVEKNKDMVQQDDGSWLLIDYEDSDSDP